MSAKRLTLDAFPCPVGIGLTCNAECRAAIDRCEAVICLWLLVYRQAVADHKCARLLRVFEKRYFGKLLDWLYFADLHDSRGRAERFGERMELWRETFRDALRAAGLE